MKSWFDPPYGPFQNWSAICWISLSELQFWGRHQRLIDGATSVFTSIFSKRQMWRHLSMVVVALKTVVQRVRSNRWRFNFERARTGGQINFLWKTAMIATITKSSILIICPFPKHGRCKINVGPINSSPTQSWAWSEQTKSNFLKKCTKLELLNSNVFRPSNNY